MSQLAIGMIETIGLTAAIEASDVCVKSANVELIGYEFSKGSGMTVVKVEGNVGAVKAAIEAATIAANKVSKVVSTKVIPRPSIEIDGLIRNKDTVGYKKEEAKEDLENDLEDINSDTVVEINEIKEVTYEDVNNNTDEDVEIEGQELDDDSYTCNICKDPECSRQKGDLKTTCMHYKKED